jgi:hypothetical protein
MTGRCGVEVPLPPQFDFVFRTWAEEAKADPALAEVLRVANADSLTDFRKGRRKGRGQNRSVVPGRRRQDAKRRKTLQRNDSNVAPPRGFEPRTYALRDGTHAWIRP